MANKLLIFLGTASFLAAAGVVPAANTQAAAPTLSVSQIVDKNLTARGGAAQWHSAQAISWSGKMDIGGGESVARTNRFLRSGSMPSSHKELVGESSAQGSDGTAKQVQVPFTLTMARPHKMRVELQFAGKTALQVYDGTQGWKVRPYLNRDDAEPFSPEELKLEQARETLDGPLADYAAKGTRVDLDGVEAVEGKPAYKLKLTHKDGSIQHVWVDARSFLDVKVEGNPRHMDGRMHATYVYQSDFRTVQGLVVPFVMQTVVDGYPDRHGMYLDKVTVNPQLAASTFSKPATAAAAKPVNSSKPVASGQPGNKGA
jgi:hypothetical protein